MSWELLYPGMRRDFVDGLPDFDDQSDDAESAREQLDRVYCDEGGAWHPTSGFDIKSGNELYRDGKFYSNPIAQAWLRHELILLYESDWVAVVQPDGSFEVARLD